MTWLDVLASLCSTQRFSPWVGIEKLLIFLVYLGIAWSFWTARKIAKEPRARRALLQLVGIFVFCGVSGYLMPILPVGQFMLFLSHAVLAVFGLWFLASNQHVVILAAMTGHDT